MTKNKTPSGVRVQVAFRGGGVQFSERPTFGGSAQDELAGWVTLLNKAYKKAYGQFLAWTVQKTSVL